MSDNRHAQDAVIFLHPVALDADASERLNVPGLITPSLIGHGDRRPAREGMSLDDMADEIAGWAPGAVHLVGCSMGGMVAMRFALRHPDRVRSLVLAYTSARVPRDVMLARAEETEQLGSAGMLDPTLRRWFSDDTLTAVPESPAVAYARRCLTSTPTQTLSNAWRAIAEHDVLDQLDRLAGLPTTCVGGRNDVSSPTATIEAMGAQIPGARVVMTDHAHMGFLENPDEFSAIVQQHLIRADAHTRSAHPASIREETQ